MASSLFIFEAVKKTPKPVFSNTQEDDVMMYTTCSNQQIHIGCSAGTETPQPSSMVVSSSNIEITTPLSTAHIVPTTTRTHDLGTSTSQFRALYLTDTRIALDPNSNICITDAHGSNLRRLVVDEIQLGADDDSSVCLKRDINGAFSVTTSSPNPLLNNAPIVTSAFPFSPTIPVVTTTAIPQSAAHIIHGRIELGSHNGTSLAPGASITITLTHNTNAVDPIVLLFPSDPQAVTAKCTTATATAIDILIKNISTAPVTSPIIYYQIIHSPATITNKTPLASPVKLLVHDTTYRVYSGPTSTSTSFTLPPLATDPQNYPIAYKVVYDSTQRCSFETTALKYNHARMTAMGAIKILAYNPYVQDNDATITFTIIETRLTPLLQSFTPPQRLTGGSYALPTTDQSIQLFWTEPTTTGDATITNNTLLTWKTPQTVTLTTSFPNNVMKEAALASRTFTIALD